MRDLKDLLMRVKQEHLDRLGSIRRELKMLPPGRLEALQQHGRIYYYQNTQAKRRGITRKPELVRQLARKRYLLEERKILQHNLKEIERALGKCESCGMNGILQKLPERISQLPRQYFYKKRRSRKYDKNPAYPENLVYATNGGEMVRSKSEQSIGNMLEEYGIDYSYDRRVDGHLYYADFTIYCRDGSKIIWEHFGLMDSDEDYHKKALWRMEDYRRQGWRQWRDLIYTFEEDVRDPRDLREIVEEFLLPRVM